MAVNGIRSQMEIDGGGWGRKEMAGAYDWRLEYWISGGCTVRFTDSVMLAGVSEEGLSVSLVISTSSENFKER